MNNRNVFSTMWLVVSVIILIAAFYLLFTMPSNTTFITPSPSTDTSVKDTTVIKESTVIKEVSPTATPSLTPSVTITPTKND